MGKVNIQKERLRKAKEILEKLHTEFDQEENDKKIIQSRRIYYSMNKIKRIHTSKKEPNQKK